MPPAREIQVSEETPLRLSTKLLLGLISFVCGATVSGTAMYFRIDNRMREMSAALSSQQAQMSAWQKTAEEKQREMAAKIDATTAQISKLAVRLEHQIGVMEGRGGAITQTWTQGVNESPAPPKP